MMFALTNDTTRPKPETPPPAPRAHQKVLFAGMDHLPGQLDLFQTDGEDAQDDGEQRLQ